MWHRHRGNDLTADDLAAIEASSPWWAGLTGEEADHLRRLTARFLDIKHFEGVRGFSPTRPMQTVIAAHACLLVLGLDLDWYRDVTSVVISPHIVDRNRPHNVDGGIVHDGPVRLSGEAMLHGPVLITWDTVRNDVIHPERGHNVVFHEFAHKLDMRSGAATGEPPLSKTLAETWHHVMSDVLNDLRKSQRPPLDSYGATNPSELLAVCTEAFFVMPHQLHASYPDLYDLFSEFYRQDPRTRYPQ